MNKEPRPHYIFWFGILGFVLGLLFVALATLIALFGLGEDVTLENICQLHFFQPLFWLEFRIMPRLKRRKFPKSPNTWVPPSVTAVVTIPIIKPG